VRGAGGFWAIEYDFENSEAASYNFGNKVFAMVVQEKAFDNGLIVMGMAGGASLDGTRGHTTIFAPAYNVTREEVETIVELFVKSLEEVLTASRVH
jgi:E3 ubiquitin-protein ligase TRIP12